MATTASTAAIVSEPWSGSVMDDIDHDHSLSLFDNGSVDVHDDPLLHLTSIANLDSMFVDDGHLAHGSLHVPNPLLANDIASTTVDTSIVKTAACSPIEHLIDDVQSLSSSSESSTSVIPTPAMDALLPRRGMNAQNTATFALHQPTARIASSSIITSRLVGTAGNNVVTSANGTSASTPSSSPADRQAHNVSPTPSATESTPSVPSPSSSSSGNKKKRKTTMSGAVTTKKATKLVKMMGPSPILPRPSPSSVTSMATTTTTVVTPLRKKDTKNDDSDNEPTIALKERNRIHAKASRQRRKSLTEDLQSQLERLKEENQVLRDFIIQRMKQKQKNDTNHRQEEVSSNEGVVDASTTDDQVVVSDIVRQKRLEPTLRFLDQLKSQPKNRKVNAKQIRFLQGLRRHLPNPIPPAVPATSTAATSTATSTVTSAPIATSTPTHEKNKDHDDLFLSSFSVVG